jgi:endonuclease YncB( thermonuclease family)
MSHRSAPDKRWLTLLALLLAAFMGYARWKGWLPGEQIRPDRPGQPPVVEQAPARPPLPGREGGLVRRVGNWDELQGCTLVEERLNDGDSFVVRHGRSDYTLRLYFADCPEKTRHQYNGTRISEQGQYFGGLTEEETVTVGEDARDFSLGLLRSAPFRVLTRWERVFDSERIYAFVTVGAGDLGELLVAEGLARIYTKGENRPGGKSAGAAKEQLRRLEQQAQGSKRGAWGKR